MSDMLQCNFHALPHLFGSDSRGDDSTSRLAGFVNQGFVIGADDHERSRDARLLQGRQYSRDHRLTCNVQQQLRLAHASASARSWNDREQPRNHDDG